MAAFEIDPQMLAGLRSSRSHETRVEIDATVEEVWASLTEPPLIERWFAPKVSVEPGVGGSLVADWGPGLEWRTTIEVWEPKAHLRLTETRDRVMSSAPIEEKLEPCRLVEDFYIESANGKTMVRLVHSGFGSDAEWDNEYEGTRSGWTSCFLRLKLGLERHRGESTYNFLFTKLIPGRTVPEVMLATDEAITEPKRAVFRTDSHLSLLLPGRNESILTLSIQSTPVGTVAYVEGLLFGQPEAECRNYESWWKDRLAELFPA